jgi:hypothetical protein
MAKKKLKEPTDAEVFKQLKASGLLNRNVTLDQLIALGAKIDVGLGAKASFIFKTFVYRRC